MMRLFYWLNLVGFISLLVALGLFRNFYSHETYNDTSCEKGAHPFLCGQKIDLKHATVGDIASVDGIAQTTALRILRFLSDHPQARMKDLIDVKGVGPKTIQRLGEYFF